MGRPNVLVILTDQLRYPPAYESAELARFRAEAMPGVERLRRAGVSFRHHYPMASACAPSRASLLTGQYPSLHGVTQTDGLAKTADGPDVSWRAPDTVPTLGDWFRAGGYRTYFKGKWHADTIVVFNSDHDNQQFWTVPGERDERLRRRKLVTVTEPEPDEFELYDLTLDPYEERNLAHPDFADGASRALQEQMLDLLVEQLEAKRLVPGEGEVPGYRPPTSWRSSARGERVGG
jgi:sulfatase-like protein